MICSVRPLARLTPTRMPQAHARVYMLSVNTHAHMRVFFARPHVRTHTQNADLPPSAKRGLLRMWQRFLDSEEGMGLGYVHGIMCGGGIMYPVWGVFLPLPLVVVFEGCE